MVFTGTGPPTSTVMSHIDSDLYSLVPKGLSSQRHDLCQSTRPIWDHQSVVSAPRGPSRCLWPLKCVVLGPREERGEKRGKKTRKKKRKKKKINLTRLLDIASVPAADASKV